MAFVRDKVGYPGSTCGHCGSTEHDTAGHPHSKSQQRRFAAMDTTPLVRPVPLPCPFCGDTNFAVEEGSTFRWRVPYCGGCGATGPEVRCQTSGEGTKESWEAAAEVAAIQSWNTRAELA